MNPSQVNDQYKETMANYLAETTRLREANDLQNALRQIKRAFKYDHDLGVWLNQNLDDFIDGFRFEYEYSSALWYPITLLLIENEKILDQQGNTKKLIDIRVRILYLLIRDVNSDDKSPREEDRALILHFATLLGKKGLQRNYWVGNELDDYYKVNKLGPYA